VRIPETRYAPSGEILIAYQVHGSGDHDLLLGSGPASNVETCWNLPEAARLFERLGRFARVIRFDRRDTGVSDPIRDDLTLEAHVADTLAVIDAVDAERPVLLGSSDGARTVAALAATHPERAAGLIAVAGTVRGGAVAAPELADQTVASIADRTWPEGIVDLFAPEWAQDPGRRDRLVRYIRTSATPRQAGRLLRMSLNSDVSEVLPLVQVPTLVLHPRESAFPAEASLEFAGLIPGAEYREIEGGSTFIYALDTEVLADAVEEFVTGSAPVPPSSRMLASVLFTDLVDSTARAAAIGDRQWGRLLRRHHESVREAIDTQGGRTVKTLGDGVLATFTGPAQAVRCAERIVREAAGDGLEVRSGVHTGEVEVSSDDVAGLAVHLAARIMALAEGGEVFVSRTVRDLVVGSELSFTDRGEHQLKGIEEPWQLYSLS
jgi:class 3 adenylate cyclase/predicted esterase